MAVVRYLVDDLEQAVRFYVDRLGFTEGRRFGPVTIVHRDDLELWLSAPGSSAVNQEGARSGGWNRLVLEVAAIDEAGDGLQARGEIVEGRAGRWLVIEDPSGNPIELFEPR